MFTVDNILHSIYPRFNDQAWFARPFKAVLRKLLHEKDFQAFSAQYPHVKGIDFVEQVLQYFNVSYTVQDTEKDNIPTTGRVVIFANHPIGTLDALVLIKLLTEVRPDLKVVANEVLMQLEPLHNMLLPVRNMQGGTPKQYLTKIHQHLTQHEGAVLIFPAGEVSRLRPTGVKDTQWHSGFLRIAMSCKAPLLPMFVDTKNSPTFYGVSMIYKPLSTLLLVKEMFNKQSKNFPIRVGEIIADETIAHNNLDGKTKVKLLKKHLYKIGHGKPGIFSTVSAIAPPENKAQLVQALKSCELLGQTQDNKQIYLYQHDKSNPIMREIGRLREVSFRTVGEGSGLKRDVDHYDQDYFHLILWDAEELEIVGAYRMADTKKLIEKTSVEALYTHSLFHFDSEMNQYFDYGLELGRSFVQPKYWGKRSLDYLWFGIGALLKKNPQYRYLFGPVSISNALPPAAKSLLVYFYGLYFPAPTKLATSHQPYQLADEDWHQLKHTFVGNNYSKDFKQLKHLLANMGTAVPTLFKQYGELCDNDGVKFLSFGVDPNFANCVDGLVLVDITQLKEKKRNRYMPEAQPIEDFEQNSF